ncbi:hypothetical protein KQI82_05075 [Oscillibacter sp. MSJ-2]|uniref:Uncharacterized protein n=1 Tax=Dysosmobacter acutus TaxID=2841504 RepID=A0ABS6F8A1_9FIRM|nr:hypothetical protein [Dysosmobacter acutus]MBU5626293.1 hypothetical protein [Dysosmobacter acutus]
MFDFLSSIYYDEPLGLQGKTPMAPPYTPQERAIRDQLESLGPKEAARLQDDIHILAQEYRNRAFQAGAEFGANLTLQLFDGIQP